LNGPHQRELDWRSAALEARACAIDAGADVIVRHPVWTSWMCAARPTRLSEGAGPDHAGARLKRIAVGAGEALNLAW